MQEQVKQGRLRAFPVQFIETRNGLVLKRGRTEVRIDGEGVIDAIQTIYAGISKDLSLSGVIETFPFPDREYAAELVQYLISRSLLFLGDEPHQVTDEQNLDVFFWQFGLSRRDVASVISRVSLAVVGVNSISCRLLDSLSTTGFSTLTLVDHPPLRNLRYYDDAGIRLGSSWSRYQVVDTETWSANLDDEGPTCIIACSDFGGQQLMREWNQLAVERGCQFLPVVLQDLVGYVGPLVIPGETACYECLRARQNSHLGNPEGERLSEYFAYEGQQVAGFHHSMASILGDIAAVELTRFYCIGPPLSQAGALIQLNLLSSQMMTQRVLKIPRCSVCSPLNSGPSIALTRAFHIPASTES